MPEKLPKAEPERIPEGFREEILALTEGEELATIEKAVVDLKREMAQARPVGRTIETTKRDEVVIPLESAEQKRRILDVLAQLAIYPWEEQGLLVIDHHRDLRKLVIAGILRAPELSVEPAIPTSTGLDTVFPLPHTETLSEIGTRKAQERRARSEPRPRVGDGETDTTPLDEEFQEIVTRFDLGLVDEDDPEFVNKAGSSFPSLRLFPRKYIWQGQGQNRTLLESQTSKIISKAEQAEVLEKAKSGDDRAFRDLAYMHRGLVLLIALRVKEKFGGDPDDLFQEGMIGLTRAVQLYELDKGAKFSTFAVYYIEGRMRRFSQETRRPVRLTGHAEQERRIVMEARERTGSTKDTVGFSRAMLKAGIKVSAKEIPDGAHLDRLGRMYLLNAVFDPVSDEEDNPIDTGSDLPQQQFAENTVAGAPREVFDAEVRREFTRLLTTLTAREERILRMRFGLGAYDPDAPGSPTTRLGRQNALPRSTEGATLEEIGQTMGVTRDRIRQIEAKALRKLKHPARSRVLRMLLDNVERDPYPSRTEEEDEISA